MIVTDQLQRTIEISDTVNRIISLVPSQTELLYDLGLGSKIVGQTIFCVHPETEFKAAEKIGGTKKLQLEKILSLKPDLVIANKEENEKDQIEFLAESVPVWISDVNTLYDATNMIASIGEMTQTDELAHSYIQKINDNLQRSKSASGKPCEVIYLIWNEPYFAVGSETFIHSMLEVSGFKNVIEQSRYPEITLEQMADLNPDYVLLSTEPFPFKETHLQTIEATVGKGKCVIVDGEMCSWYGSRLVKGLDYLHQLQQQLSH